MYAHERVTRTRAGYCPGMTAIADVSVSRPSRVLPRLVHVERHLAAQPGEAVVSGLVARQNESGWWFLIHAITGRAVVDERLRIGRNIEWGDNGLPLGLFDSKEAALDWAEQHFPRVLGEGEGLVHLGSWEE